MLSDNELLEAWRRGELVVTDADEETKARLLDALDAEELTYDKAAKE